MRESNKDQRIPGNILAERYSMELLVSLAPGAVRNETGNLVSLIQATER